MMDICSSSDGTLSDSTEHSSGLHDGQSGPMSPLRAKSENKGKEVKECRVCGDSTTGTYFGAVVCLPCKTFFIRYGSEGSRRLRCRSENDCSITISTRTRCKQCRLMKCYTVGMMRKERPEVMQVRHGQELCSVCRDIANGIHFGTYTCEGCKKFFRRGLKESPSYRCSKGGVCVVNPRSRNTCRYCRFNKCLAVGMTPKVRVGRPRKAQREFLLSSIQKRAAHNLEAIQTAGGKSEDWAPRPAPSPPTSPHSPPAPSAHLTDSSLSSASSASSSSSSSASHTFFSDDSADDHTFTPPPLTGDPRSQAKPEKEPEVDRVSGVPHQAVLMAPFDRLEDGRLGRVQVGDFTYLLSETLSARYLHVVLPYWTHPLLPPGGLPVSPAQHTTLSRLTAAHVVAVNALRGPLPPATVLAEATISSELTENVGEFLRIRLVRILNAFITFVKSQNDLVDIAEQDIPSTIRMTVNTWSLIGAAPRYLEGDRLVHVQDVPLHPDNPHTPLTRRNMLMAHKLFKLQLDDTEAALLAITCILATDIIDMMAPEDIEEKRWRVLELFRAYTTAKYGWPNWRMEELFACVPEMRLAAIWFNDLSYTTWFPPKHCHHPASSRGSGHSHSSTPCLDSS